MNRTARDRRNVKRSGSHQRRGNTTVRARPNPKKAARISEGRRLWKANAK